MRPVFLAVFFAPLLTIFHTQELSAFEINCDSPVWAKSDECNSKNVKDRPPSIRASEDDMGGADILGPDSEIDEDGFKAFCGPKSKPCRVSFQDGRLSINKGRGITRNQLIRVTTDRTCRERFMGIPNCYEHQYDFDYTFTYRDLKGNERAALIAFRPGNMLGRGNLPHQAFKRELQVWVNDVLRPIGPSIEIE